MSRRGLRLDPTVRALLGHSLHDEITTVSAMRWGWFTPTARIELASGRRLIVQRLAATDARRVIRASTDLGVAGVPVPDVAAEASLGRRSFVAYEEVGGVPAAELFGTARAAGMALAMARALRRLRRVPVGAVAADAAWSTPAALVDATSRWIGATGLDEPTAARLSAAADRIAAAGWRGTTTHGDFVPANALIDGRRLATLVDLGGVARRHALVDPAWWLLVVRHHHPADLAAVEKPFIGTALGGLPAGSHALLAAVAIVRALQLLARVPRASRAHQRALLLTALDWEAADVPPPLDWNAT